MKAPIRLIIMALAVFVAFASSALADPFRLRIENTTSGTGVVITDNSAGDANSDPGVISFDGSLGNFAFNVTTGLSDPAVGNASVAALQLWSVNINAGGPGTLRITLEDNGYNIGGPGSRTLTASAEGALLGPAGSTVNFSAWANPSNQYPVLGPDDYTPGTLAAIGPTPSGSANAFGPGGVTYGSGLFSTTDSTSFIKTSGPYSLFTQVTLNFTGAGGIGFDESLAVGLPTTTLVNPEPSSVLLLGTGLIGLVAFRRRWARSN